MKKKYALDSIREFPITVKSESDKKECIKKLTQENIELQEQLNKAVSEVLKRIDLKIEELRTYKNTEKNIEYRLGWTKAITALRELKKRLGLRLND